MNETRQYKLRGNSLTPDIVLIITITISKVKPYNFTTVSFLKWIKALVYFVPEAQQ
jgi:hypothetical protein